MKTAIHTDRNGSSEATLRLAPVLLLAVALVFPAFAFGQTNEGEGKEMGGYVVHQSIEFGGHLTDFGGSTDLWDTFVNLKSGARLLDQSLELHSPNHNGSLLFDDLTTSAFGWGGDPNNLATLKVSKGHAYNFTATFRRDRNFWDYDLLANPLNPTAPGTSNPIRPYPISPHEFATVRRNTDLSLVILPESKVRIRFGYNRNVSEGGSLSSIHEGTDALLDQQWRNGLDAYSMGVDFRFLPRTTFSYDQFLFFYKGDTAWYDQLNAPGNRILAGLPAMADQFFIAGGRPVDLGIPFNTSAGQPCATPFLATQFVNPACNGYFSYLREAPTRSSFPTEQFSFQSNYWRKLDLSGRAMYTGADSNVDHYGEFFDGLITRNRVRQENTLGATAARRITSSADFGVTYHAMDRLHFTDNFRWANFRIPGSWALAVSNFVGATLASPANVFTPATCPPPFTAATCPQHNSSSAADLILDARNDFLGQNSFNNTFLVDYDFNRRVSAHAGYRYERREITQRIDNTQVQVFFPGPTAALANRGACAPAAAHPLKPDGPCTALVPSADTGEDSADINGHTGIFGVYFRPMDNLRLSAETEFTYFDNQFYRISPRHVQDYHIRGNYRPVDWVTLAALVHIRENRNTSFDIGNLQHNRNYGFTAAFAPADSKWSVDLSYAYTDIFSQTNICFVASSVFVPPGQITCGTPFLSGVSLYQSNEHFGAVNFMLHPVKRVTGTAGYTLTSVSGDTLILNPNTPTGPLAFNYHLPTASVAIDLVKNWSFRTGWNYYDYNEKSAAGPTLPRDFHGNVWTLAFRYAY